ncbi:nucleotide sugar dehydrogenase [Pelagicoccus mobilis]|uniref:UDP-glucose 6-dehydrogenase n=1 Tax=Pelagicoccus mobilis TaxID=415221 RepID=A0A934RUL9_9BACT|nr:nucleotide sugar dehydrogenase [Pelagicoccus mobilis]MBK1877945.1 nucleotide sugar dehydrogenase [Pelagicoccus mobilis]
MKIGIFGLGYVGLTTGACMLRSGFDVIGYEISDIKRKELASGRVPLCEPGVGPVVIAGISEGRFRVADHPSKDDLPDVFFISVGTPSDDRGGTNLKAVNSVFSTLADMRSDLALKGSEIVLRSTVPPGTLEVFARKFEALFRVVPVAFYPEFLREGTAIKDFENPPQTVVGKLANSPNPTKLISIFEHLDFEYRVVDAVSAETLKFACNGFHALKICFANELGRIVSSFGGNPREVMELFVKDTQLNISPRYLLPGAPFGGSCLPKETRSLRNLSASRGLQTPTICSCEESNQSHFSYVIDCILALNPKRLAILGLAFKKDTDDIRESPTVEILYRLAAYGGIEFSVHDYLVRPETAFGVNQRLLDKLISLPKISFSNRVGEVLEGADTILIMHTDKRYELVTRNLECPIIDVARWEGMSRANTVGILESRRSSGAGVGIANKVSM